jgi:LssY-like putative type I secretion system component LssY
MITNSDSSPPSEKAPEIEQAASSPSIGEVTISPLPKRRSRRKQFVTLLAGLLLIWLVMAYLVMPALWKGYAHRHPSLEDIPRITHTGSDIPGDPLNVALIGTETELKKLMLAAKWYPADPLTLRSCLMIAEDTVIKRAYDDAPVSNLYLFGRKQDFAFQQPVGDNPRQRHHVRFWLSDKVDPDSRPVWIGAAIYDRKVGLSRTTGQITHHTAADIDTERDKLFDDLKKTGDLVEEYAVEGFHTIREGRNGGGDPWKTDGNLFVGVIKPSD